MPKTSSGFIRYGEDDVRRDAYGTITNSDEVEEDTQTYSGWREAFPDRNGDWAEYADSYGHRISSDDEADIYHDWSGGGNHPWGYVMTGNSFRINEQLYNPANDGKTDEEIFTLKDNQGRLRDLQTVRALDRAISNGRTPSNAIYTRYAGFNSTKSNYGLSDEQMSVLQQVQRMAQGGGVSPDVLKQLNNAMRGTRVVSKSYTSTSANSKMNFFTHKPIIRKMYVPEGTPAFAARRNNHESEVVFGRRVETALMGITVENGHLVFHERFVGYRKK